MKFICAALLIGLLTGCSYSTSRISAAVTTYCNLPEDVRLANRIATDLAVKPHKIRITCADQN